MKILLTTLSMAAALSVSVTSTAVFAATPIEIPKIQLRVLQRPLPRDVINSCNVEYAACLRNGARMSLADGTSNWARCNRALAACLNNPR